MRAKHMHMCMCMCMHTSSQGDVRSSPMAYPLPSGAVAAKTPATSTARDADYLLDDNYLFGQNVTEHNPAPSPSGHPLLSSPPTLNDLSSPDLHKGNLHVPFTSPAS